MITCQNEAQHKTIPQEENNSGEEDLFQGFEEDRARMPVASTDELINTN